MAGFMLGSRVTAALAALFLVFASQMALAVTTYCYVDSDGDGFGAGTATPVEGGQCPAGQVDNNLDCDDSDATIYPGAVDPPGDGIDQNCDGSISCFRDGDNDGYGSTLVMPSQNPFCSGPGESSNSADCDDSDGTINPMAIEIAADGVDQNCDGQEICFVDLDGDGYGSTSTTTSPNLSCSDPGESALNTDCDDDRVTVYPDAAEICDGLDNDCDLLTDEGGVCPPPVFGDGFETSD